MWSANNASSIVESSDDSSFTFPFALIWSRILKAVLLHLTGSIERSNLDSLTSLFLIDSSDSFLTAELLLYYLQQHQKCYQIQG